MRAVGPGTKHRRSVVTPHVYVAIFVQILRGGSNDLHSTDGRQDQSRKLVNVYIATPFILFCRRSVTELASVV